MAREGAQSTTPLINWKLATLQLEAYCLDGSTQSGTKKEKKKQSNPHQLKDTLHL